MSSLRIAIVSDFVCPWCYVGERQLSRAVRARGDLRFDWAFEPFLLHPYVPEGGMPRAELMTRKFGPHARRVTERIRAAGAEVGIDFDFDSLEHVPQTLNAHALMDAAPKERARELALRLFRAYFEEARDIGDVEVLRALAEEEGLETTQVDAALAPSSPHRERAADAARRARDEGVTAVPFFSIGGFVVQGAQRADTFVRVIDKVLEKRRRAGMVSAPQPPGSGARDQ